MLSWIQGLPPSKCSEKISEGQNELRKDVTDLLAKTENLIADVGKRFLEIENHISELKLKTAKLDDLDNLICTQKTIEFQTRKLPDLEDRSSWSNVVVFGIAEDPAESEADIRRKVITDTFERKLNVKCDSVDRIHRLGKAATNATNRPVILFFQDYNEKAYVTKNVKKLKGTKIFVQDDYSQQTLQKRKLLWKSSKADKSQGKTAYLIHDK